MASNTNETIELLIKTIKDKELPAQVRKAAARRLRALMAQAGSDKDTVARAEAEIPPFEV